MDIKEIVYIIISASSWWTLPHNAARVRLLSVVGRPVYLVGSDKKRHLQEAWPGRASTNLCATILGKKAVTYSTNRRPFGRGVSMVEGCINCTRLFRPKLLMPTNYGLGLEFEDGVKRSGVPANTLGSLQRRRGTIYMKV